MELALHKRSFAPDFAIETHFTLSCLFLSPYRKRFRDSNLVADSILSGNYILNVLDAQR